VGSAAIVFVGDVALVLLLMRSSCRDNLEAVFVCAKLEKLKGVQEELLRSDGESCKVCLVLCGGGFVASLFN
jgi:hypothetical protein